MHMGLSTAHLATFSTSTGRLALVEEEETVASAPTGHQRDGYGPPATLCSTHTAAIFKRGRGFNIHTIFGVIPMHSHSRFAYSRRNCNWSSVA